jgi:hypothetical protein
MVEPGFKCVHWIPAVLGVAAWAVIGCASGYRSTAAWAAGQPLKSTEFIWGVQGHPGQQAAYAPTGPGLARQFDYLQRLGTTHYRIDLEPDDAGTVDPAFAGILDLAASRGIEILPLLVAEPNQDGSISSNYRRGYAVAFNFAARYGGRLSHVEVGNELDNRVLKFTVDSTVSPVRIAYEEGSSLTQYVDTLLRKTTSFLRGMTDGIHQAAPETLVIINAGWRHYAFFEALARDSVRFDVYGYHWYSDMGDFAAEVLPHLPDMDKEVWITEANRKNSSRSYDAPAAQAEWIGRFARELWGIARVKALFIYELYEELAFGRTEAESYYGIVGCSDESCSGPAFLKPAFHAYQDAIRGLTGGAPVTALRLNR